MNEKYLTVDLEDLALAIECTACGCVQVVSDVKGHLSPSDYHLACPNCDAVLVIHDHPLARGYQHLRDLVVQEKQNKAARIRFRVAA